MSKHPLTMRDICLPLCDIGNTNSREMVENEMTQEAAISGYTFGVISDKTVVATFSDVRRAIAFARKYIKDHPVITYVRDMVNGAQYFKWDPKSV